MKLEYVLTDQEVFVFLAQEGDPFPNPQTNMTKQLAGEAYMKAEGLKQYYVCGHMGPLLVMAVDYVGRNASNAGYTMSLLQSAHRFHPRIRFTVTSTRPPEFDTWKSTLQSRRVPSRRSA